MADYIRLLVGVGFRFAQPNLHTRVGDLVVFKGALIGEFVREVEIV